MQTFFRKPVEVEGIQFDGRNIEEISQFCFGKPVGDAQENPDIWIKAYWNNDIMVLGIMPPWADIYTVSWEITQNTWILREKGNKHFYLCDDERFNREYSSLQFGQFKVLS